MNVVKAIVLFFVIPSMAWAGDFYDATAPRTYPGDSLSYYYNPGPDNAGDPNHIIFDDVTVPWLLPQSLFNVTKVTFKVTQKTGAGAVDITPYRAQFVPDAVRDGGAEDGEMDDPDGAQSIGVPTHFPANSTGHSIEHLFSYGDGVHTLFQTWGAEMNPSAGFHSFAIGLKFSTADSLNGWTLAAKPGNYDVLWDYTDSSHFREFTYQYGGDEIDGTQNMKVSGQVLSGMPGDATIDGSVNISDLLALAQHWHQPGDYMAGDFDFDTYVDMDDLKILAQNWGGEFSKLSAALASLGLPDVSVPEPASTIILFVGLPAMLRRRRCA